MSKKNEENKIKERDNSQKIQSLRDMISTAEKTIQGAKAMLLQMEGKKKMGRRRKMETENEDGQIIQGTFDGQLMIGVDGKQYPIPANYASKSKLVEGDMLKLTITSDGSFIYKQIGPAERKNLIGIASQDENENYYVIAEGKPYKIILASITYFKIEPGDEVAIVTSHDIDSHWAAVESVLQKSKEKQPEILSAKDDLPDSQYNEEVRSQEGQKDKVTEYANKKNEARSNDSDSDTEKSILDEWAPDIKEIEKELQEEKKEKIQSISKE